MYSTAGTMWNGAPKFSSNGNQPVTMFDLVEMSTPEVISFRVYSMFTGSLTHISGIATVTIACGSGYTIT